MLPPDLKLLVDGDILRYEIGFGAETGWKALTNEEGPPPWSFVSEMLHQRIEKIKAECKTSVEPMIFFTEGRTFRDDIAKTKPYKGTRKDKKPWHFKNLSVYLEDVMKGVKCTGIEADDAMAIVHTDNPATIICSRDKDLKQVPGWFYSWELGAQPSFGPTCITKEGSLELIPSKPPKLKGTGNLFFYAQVLMGDTVDNIPGLPKVGPVAAYELLTNPNDERPPYQRVVDAYKAYYGEEKWYEAMQEQAQLCWIVRAMKDNTPVVWQHGMDT